VRERLKEPRKGSEIEPEIICVQGVGAQHFVLEARNNKYEILNKHENYKKEKLNSRNCF